MKEYGSKLLRGKMQCVLGLVGVGLIFSIFPCNSIAKKPHPVVIQGPWLTGPLLAAAGVTEDPGSVDIEPYLFLTKSYSVPRLFAINPSLSSTIGLAKRLDTEAIIPYVFNNEENQWTHHFQDITLILGYQAIKTNQNDCVPNLRLVVQEIFPSGKFQNLSPARPGLNATGAGSYQTGFGANFEQTYRLTNAKYLHLLLNLLYSVPSSVHVSGFDAYGGGFGTNGVVNLGNSVNVDLAFEYTLTQNWAMAMDATYLTVAASPFQGTAGSNADGSPASVGSLPSQQVTLAPAIEYNFSEHWGLIAGMWFTVHVHNTSNFVSGVIALNYSS